MRKLACEWGLGIVVACGGFACGDDGGGGDDNADPTGGADSGTTGSTTWRPTSGDSSGSPPPATTGSGTSGPGNGSTTGGSTTDDDGDTTTTGAGTLGSWMLTVDHGRSPSVLVQVEAGRTSIDRCTLPPAVDYRSLAFGRSGQLYAFNAAAERIDRLNPCDCSFQPVGSTSIGGLSLATGAPGDDGLLAIASGLDALVRVDTATGLANTIGGFTFPFEGVGVAWSDSIDALYAIEGSQDYVYSIDPATAVDTDLLPLLADVTNPGLVEHPADGVLYACVGTMLMSFDPTTGQLDPVGAIASAGPCETLAAPTEPVDCIDS